MTTAAEALTASFLVSKHSTIAALARSIEGQASAMAKAANILTAIGNGANPATAYNSLDYQLAAAAVIQASRAASGNGNTVEAQGLRTAQMVLINLSQGL